MNKRDAIKAVLQIEQTHREESFEYLICGAANQRHKIDKAKADMLINTALDLKSYLIDGKETNEVIELINRSDEICGDGILGYDISGILGILGYEETIRDIKILAKCKNAKIHIPENVLKCLQNTICSNGKSFIEDADSKPLKWLQNKQNARVLFSRAK